MIKNTHDFKPLEGKYVNLREVELNDAAFILSLRCNEKKSRFLHKTENNLEKQIEYLKRYKTLDNEWYFIIENKRHTPLGTTRIYDVQGNRYTPGSWLMKDGSLPEETLEGSLLAGKMAYEVLGFEKGFFDVRKGNKRVIRFHLSGGAKIIGEDEDNYYFEATKESYLKIKPVHYAMLG